MYLRFAAWVQEHLAAAEERLRSAKLEAALAEHQAEVEAVVSQMREGGASEHDITMYEVQEHVAVVEEAEMGAAEVKRSLHRRVKPGPVCLCCCRDFPPVLSPMRAGEVRQRARPGGLPIHRHRKFVPRVRSVIAAQVFLVRCLADLL